MAQVPASGPRRSFQLATDDRKTVKTDGEEQHTQKRGIPTREGELFVGVFIERGIVKLEEAPHLHEKGAVEKKTPEKKGAKIKKRSAKSNQSGH